MTVFAADPFTAPNGTVIHGRTLPTPGSGTWHSIVAAGAATIESNQATPFISKGYAVTPAMAQIAPGSADYFVTAKMVNTLNTVGPAVRMSYNGSTYSGYCFTGRQLYKLTNDSLASLGDIGSTPASGTVLKLLVVGTTLKCYWDGILKLTVTDATIASAGYPGTYGQGPVDDFVADDAIPAVPLSVTDIVATGANDNSVGTVAWANPDRITADDASRSVATIATKGHLTNYLKGTNGPDVPAGATIVGIALEIERSWNVANVDDSIVRLVKGGAVVGDNKSAGAAWPGGDNIATFGHDEDLWGTTWTDAEVNATDFGAVVQASARGPGSVARVDFMRITVYYYPPADITPPVLTVLGGPTRSRMSRVAGRDESELTWESSEDFAAYKIKHVPATDSLHTAGILIEQDQNPASGGTAGTDYTTTITDDELEAATPTEENKYIKVFVQDAAGNWSV